MSERQPTNHPDRTINLPRTKFPMQADLPRREPEILRRWQRMDLYRLARERAAGKPAFIVHDGPPFSYGDVHLGHALNKILKDFVVKFRAMQGYDTPFIPGWDTHGLPTEIHAVRTFATERYAIPPRDLRHRCAEMARKAVDAQRRMFQRLGVRADWGHPYLTMEAHYTAGVLETFRRLVAGGYVYRAKMPVYWCLECETALAAAEVEFREHEVPSVYVAFPLVRLPNGVFAGHDLTHMSGVVWTTTPWTLPANTAIAVNPRAPYALVMDETDSEGFLYLVARELVPRFAGAVAMKRPRIVAEAPGDALEGAAFLHPFLPRTVPLVQVEGVSLNEGTGMAPVAPAHSREDFLTGRSYGLPMIAPVGPTGVYGKEAGPFAGKTIYGAQDEMLRRMDRDGTLLAVSTIRHQYPHCWRCREPVIMRAAPQWFLALDRLGARAQTAIDAVRWLPAWGHDRMTSLVHQRPDWCLSRQRVWGTPIPAVYCASCGEPLLTPELVQRVIEQVHMEGADAWYHHPAEFWLPPGTTCPQCGNSAFRAETDIFDVWFDSGCSHAAVLSGDARGQWPADLYLEGQDQYRGWYQVSLFTSLAAGWAEAPYRTVLAHGFVLDHTGREQEKKSADKSPGHLIDPAEVTRKYGADLLRLWVASVDIRADMVMSEDSFGQVRETYRRIRNTFRFLLGNLADFSPRLAREYTELDEIDRWALHRLGELIQQVTDAFERYAFHRAYRALNEFCAEMSGFYLAVVKDRLYTSVPDDPARRAAQTVLWQLAVTLAQLLAPMLSFTADEVWWQLPGVDAVSAQLTDWPRPREHWHNEALAERWAQLLAVRTVVNGALAEARRQRRVGQPASAKVILYAAGESKPLLESFGTNLSELLLVAETEIVPLESAPTSAHRGGISTLAIQVVPASGAQCPRCRRWQIPADRAPVPALCVRCADTVEHLRRHNRSAA